MASRKFRKEKALTPEEIVTGIAYGETFSLYDRQDLESVMVPLKERFVRSGIDLSVFKGKRCLDVGCGSGRGTLFMLRHGADYVCSIDINQKLIHTTKKWTAEFGYNNVDVQLQSALEIEYDDESFDIVFCNGVLHRTADTDKGLCEIARVLKMGGQTFLYLLGSGGVNFHLIDWIRCVLKGANVLHALALLRLAGVEKMELACHADDWFNSYFKRYTVKDVQTRLKELGFDTLEPLRGGTSYDSSRKLASANEEQRAYLGDGDLRFFATKIEADCSHEHRLPDVGSKGSHYSDSPLVTRYFELYQNIGSCLNDIATMPEGLFTRLCVMHRINSELSSRLDAGDTFDGDGYYKFLEGILDEMEVAVTTSSSTVFFENDSITTLDRHE